jgi:ferredoxin
MVNNIESHGNTKRVNSNLEGGYQMKAHVDKETCIGCGLCPSIASDVFDMQEDGKAGEIVDSVPEGSEGAAQEAAESCPVAAISVD